MAQEGNMDTENNYSSIIWTSLPDFQLGEELQAEPDQSHRKQILSSKNRRLIKNNRALLPTPISLVRNALLRMEFARSRENPSGLMTRDQIQLLARMLPRDEQIREIRTMQKLGFVLTPEEEWCLNFEDFEHVQERCEFWIFKSAYNARLGQAGRDMDSMILGLGELDSSRTFRCILQVANVLGESIGNDKTGLDFLGRLSTLKSRTDKKSLLYHVCRLVLKKYPDSGDLLYEFPNLITFSKCADKIYSKSTKKRQEILDPLANVSDPVLRKLAGIDYDKFKDYIATNTNLLTKLMDDQYNLFVSYMKTFGYKESHLDRQKVVSLFRMLRQFAEEYKVVYAELRMTQINKVSGKPLGSLASKMPRIEEDENECPAPKRVHWSDQYPIQTTSLPPKPSTLSPGLRFSPLSVSKSLQFINFPSNIYAIQAQLDYDREMERRYVLEKMRIDEIGYRALSPSYQERSSKEANRGSTYQIGQISCFQPLAPKTPQLLTRISPQASPKTTPNKQAAFDTSQNQNLSNTAGAQSSSISPPAPKLPQSVTRSSPQAAPKVSSNQPVTLSSQQQQASANKKSSSIDSVTSRASNPLPTPRQQQRITSPVSVLGSAQSIRPNRLSFGDGVLTNSTSEKRNSSIESSANRSINQTIEQDNVSSLRLSDDGSISANQTPQRVAHTSPGLNSRITSMSSSANSSQNQHQSARRDHATSSRQSGLLSSGQMHNNPMMDQSIDGLSDDQQDSRNERTNAFTIDLDDQDLDIKRINLNLRVKTYDLTGDNGLMVVNTSNEMDE